jgi:hypothetical protein
MAGSPAFWGGPFDRQGMFVLENAFVAAKLGNA